MIKSLKCKQYDTLGNNNIYCLEDDDFGVIEVIHVGGESGCRLAGLIIATEYSKRDLNVAKNLAIWMMQYHNEHSFRMDWLCEWQDELCSKHILNWDRYAKSRNEYLQKFLLLE